MQGLFDEFTQDKTKLSRLLIVDHDPYLRASLQEQLGAEGFNHIFDTGCASRLNEIIKDTNPDLIILDAHMQNSGGVELSKVIRNEGFNKPILFLLARDVEGEIIEALEASGDEYIKKPLRVDDLFKRIYNNLHQSQTPDLSCYELADLNFSPENKMLYGIECERLQALTEKETKILQALYQALPESVTKEKLLSEVWGLQSGLSTHTLETHIYRLRQKITRLTKNSVIITATNGYQLNL